MATRPADSIAFACTGCGYQARLAPHYHGKAIRCPKCEAPQLVGVVVPTATARLHPPGRVAFDCADCGHHASLDAEYAGKVVWCPACNAVGIVAKPAPIVDAAADPGFSCQACGFQSRVVPSGVNGVVYCLSCRAPQSMTAAKGTDAEDASALAADPAFDVREADKPKTPLPPTVPTVRAGLGKKDRHTTSVQVAQQGARKVYRTADQADAVAKKKAAEPAPAIEDVLGEDDAKDDEAKKGLIGRITSRFFRKK